MRISLAPYIIILFVALLASNILSQHIKSAEPVVASKLAQAQVRTQTIYTFDVARPVELFDAIPSGKLWFATDVFGVEKTIIINGVRNETRFGAISPYATKISPNNEYLIWTGTEHSYDSKSYNTSTTSVFRYDMKTGRNDSIATYECDNPTTTYTPTGDHWAVVMPAANINQTGIRDVVLLDGTMISSGYPHPKMFTLSSDLSSWGYRSTDGHEENLITPSGKILLSERSTANQFIAPDDPSIYRFSPRSKLDMYTLEGRDFDFRQPYTATLYKTSYFPSAADTAKQYLVFNGKRQFASSWISNIQIDSVGHHIIYFMCDTAGKLNGMRALVVLDNSVIAGPYDRGWHLYLSPSGNHFAWSAATGGKLYLYVDGVQISRVGEYMNFLWSPDESKFMYATSDEHDKIFVVGGKKRSASYDSIGRLGFSDDGTAVEFCAIKYNKLEHIHQRFE